MTLFLKDVILPLSQRLFWLSSVGYRKTALSGPFPRQETGWPSNPKVTSAASSRVYNIVVTGNIAFCWGSFLTWSEKSKLCPRKRKYITSLTQKCEVSNSPHVPLGSSPSVRPLFHWTHFPNYWSLSWHVHKTRMVTAPTSQRWDGGLITCMGGLVHPPRVRHAIT